MSLPYWSQSLQAPAFEAMMCLNFSQHNLSIFLFSSFTLKGFSAKVMAECSLYKEKPWGLLDPNHRASLLLFQVQFCAPHISPGISLIFLQRIGHGWVREVHMHASTRKRGKSYVLFRNRQNQVPFQVSGRS